MSARMWSWLGSALATASAFAALGLFAGCGGSSGGAAGVGASASPSLIKLEYGRLVDIYSFRRNDIAVKDRRATTNRAPHLIRRDIVIRPDIETQELFDAVGEVRNSTNFRFLPFDVSVGHDELVILWDDRDTTGESDRFQEALERATIGLVEVPASYRGQNIGLKPIPVVPRNAALKLTFDRALGVTSDFFSANPNAAQVLRFRDDPKTSSPFAAFEPADTRVLADGAILIVDTTLIGPEARGRRVSTGLAPSQDNQTANFRLAIPVGGVVSRQMSVQADAVPELNDIDSRGDAAVIRDFRSGNASDGRVGALSDVERPTVVANIDMGIIGIDSQNLVLTLNKRTHLVALRGRLPFVDGGVDKDSGLPRGPNQVPTVDENGNAMPLRAGDVVVQNVISPVTGEAVRIRAEVVQNMDVGTVIGDASFAGPGRTANGTDGGEMTVARVRVTSLTAEDSQGNQVSFEPNTLPLGADCKVQVRYHEFVRYGSSAGSGEVSDAMRRAEFLEFDPPPPSLDPVTGQPIPVAVRRTHISPEAGVALRFSEPLDVSSVNSLDNYLLTNQEAHVGVLQAVLDEPKSASLSIVMSRLVDQSGDGTLMKLVTPMGHFHQKGNKESYWFHLDLGKGGVADLAGNKVDIFDRRSPGTTTIGAYTADVPLANFSVEYELDAEADDNWVGSVVHRFASADEDGTKPGSLDFFGQFQILDGKLSGAKTTRVKLTADDQNLGSIQRWDKGECVFPANPMGMPPTPAFSTPPNPGQSFGPGVLYWTPSMIAVQLLPPLVFQPPMGPQTFGGIVEPHTARGSRLQMTYREDDFGLSYHNSSDLNLDVEQLHWAPWLDMAVLFDTFDRYSMSLTHSKKRPDLLFEMVLPPMQPPECQFECLSLYSGLQTTFKDNYLENAPVVQVVKDREYVINAANAFRALSGTKYVPYPKFETTFTWRDSRIPTWDMTTDQAVGFGGALDATGNPGAGGDKTASVSSPWIQDDPESSLIPSFSRPLTGWTYNSLVRDAADFLGDRTRDHDPIALPLLVDISVFPDDSQSVATAGNLFHIAFVGPIPGGYYNVGAGISTSNPPAAWQCNNVDWPFFRVHSSGGPDPNTKTVVLIEPDKEKVARGGVIKDMGLGDPVFGLYQTKPGDDHLHWAQIDLVRRVSMVTWGFVDTLRPNQHELASLQPAYPALPPASGRPDFTGINAGDLAIQDLMAVIDPPVTTQSGGTSIKLEFRGARVIPNSDGLYDPVTNDTYAGRKNLRNPNYACEAYRYAMANPGKPSTDPRVRAEGLTPYVVEEDLDSIRDPIRQLLPRYLSYRLILENNIQSNPPVSPTIKGFGIVYRMGSTN